MGSILATLIAEREARQLIVQCGGRIWTSATIKLYLSVMHCGPARKLSVGPLRDLTFLSLDEYESVSDRRRRLTRQRVQRHRGRTDEARRETARAADRKRLCRQNEVDVRRSQRLASYHSWLCSATANCIKASREAPLRGQPCMH